MSQWQQAHRQAQAAGQRLLCRGLPQGQMDQDRLQARVQASITRRRTGPGRRPSGTATITRPGRGMGLHFSSVIGTFDSVSPGATETGQQNGRGPQVPNTYSLQVNTNHFIVPQCSPSPNPQCRGWQQFISRRRNVPSSWSTGSWPITRPVPADGPPSGTRTRPTSTALRTHRWVRSGGPFQRPRDSRAFT